MSQSVLKEHQARKITERIKKELLGKHGLHDVREPVPDNSFIVDGWLVQIVYRSEKARLHPELNDAIKRIFEEVAGCEPNIYNFMAERESPPSIDSNTHQR